MSLIAVDPFEAISECLMNQKLLFNSQCIYIKLYEKIFVFFKFCKSRFGSSLVTSEISSFILVKKKMRNKYEIKLYILA